MELVTEPTMIGGLPVLALHGEIDLATLPQLYDALGRITLKEQGQSVVVDLDGIYACDDAALGVLLGAAGRVRDGGGELVVVCSDGPLRSRLARTGFDQAIAVVGSTAAAVAALS